MGKNISDEILIEGIRSEDRKIFDHIYTCYFPEICWLYVNREIITQDDAKDIFQETVIDVFKNVLNSGFKIECRFNTYFFTVFRKKLWKKLESENKTELLRDVDFDNFADDDGKEVFKEINSNEMFREEAKNILRKIISETDEKCKNILIMYSQNYTFKEIAEELDLPDENIARGRKRNCINALIKQIKENKSYYIFKKIFYNE